MVEFLPFYFFYSLLFQLSSVDMYISTLFFFIPVLIREREGYSFGPLRFSFSLSVRVSRRVSCCRSVSASIRMKCP